MGGGAPTVGAAVGMSVCFTVVGLEKADKPASVIGALIALAGLALAVYGSLTARGSRPNIGLGSRSQPETALPSCASCWCASAQASIAAR